MRRSLEALFARLHPLVAPGSRFEWAWPVLEAGETFLLTPGARTVRGAHVRDPMDMKRLMIIVVYALVPCILLGMWNVGYQGYLAEGLADPGLVSCLLRGAWHMLPIVFVSYAVGGAWELLFCVVRKHEVNEGFLVTGILYPLTLPPDIPLWMVAMGVSFGVVIGKEVFGGVGMNILNPALTARAFVFFTYPAVISGSGVWDVATVANPVAPPYAATHVDGYTGATSLLTASAAQTGSAVDAIHASGLTWWDLFVGVEPGSMGETSALAAVVGAAILVLTGIGAWRIMVACVAGLTVTAVALHLGSDADSLPILHLPWYYHLVMGGFAFGTVFMATDPVSGSNTRPGQWVYGFGIGMLTVLIRAVNPAYPEGVMLAILFMNVFAPLIDYVVVKQGTRRRVARLAAGGA